jgi:hypothetical protein
LLTEALDFGLEVGGDRVDGKAIVLWVQASGEASGELA